jgi:glycosyltransferase involved in cell wall biosynthesis
MEENDELAQVRKAWDRETGALTARLEEKRETPGWVLADAARLEDEQERARETEKELTIARERQRSLLHENSALRKERAALLDQVSEIESSLGWLLIRRISHIRAKLLREGTIRGRCWALSARFIKTAATSGITVALRKALVKFERKLIKRLRGYNGSTADFLSRVLPRKVPVDRFRELPWKFLGPDPRDTSRKRGYFKVLLVSHSACRTGAPICLLRLAHELSRVPDVECWIVLKQGGELTESFARVAPTLEYEKLIAQGVNRDHATGLIASAFQEYSSRGVAICNTLAVSDFHAAFAERNVAVLSWVHELPTFIASLGGSDAIERIKAGSRKIMVPAEAVRTALTTQFGIDPESIRTVYNGQDPNTLGLDREAMRLRVRQELLLPPDARIVLGCGTVDLRKGADIFVNVARRVLTDPLAASLSSNTWFVWVGHCTDADFERWLVHDAAIGGLKDRIRFIGTRPETSPYYLAADVLALTSREDPCPLVNMEAMESALAVVAFQDAGGASEVLADAGLCVPYLDAGAMASAVRKLLADGALCDEMGRRGQARIRERFTWRRFMNDFLDILQTDFEYCTSRNLKISVIVPNYRHATFLEERLRSIFDQTLHPHEIIFLDDASPDDSVEVARRLAPLAPVPLRIVVNQQNSGSTFRQWLKGLSLATGDLIWLAESDDSAHPLFLERMVPEFYDPDVVLCYCQSAIVGPAGETWADDFHAHTDDISPTRWRSRYSVWGAEEAELALSQKNTIPNASAVVFRRPNHLDFADELGALRFAGDWLFYAMLIRSGKITYLPEILNFYRRHDQTVTHRSVRENTHAQESLLVKARVLETFGVSSNAIACSLARTVLEYNQLSERMDTKRPALTANPRLIVPLNRIRARLDRDRPARNLLNILLVAGELDAGAESHAVVQLANALAREHRVFLCNAQPSRCDLSIAAELDLTVILLEGTLGQTPWQAEEMPLDKRGPLAGRRAQVLRELIRFHRIDVIHSVSWCADRVVLPIIVELKLSWLIHLKGVLEVSSGAAAADLDSSRLATAVLARAKGFFYEHESELMLIEQRGIPLAGAGARWLFDTRQSSERLAAKCTEAYREVCSLLPFPRGEGSTAPSTEDTPSIPSRRLA